MSTALAPSRERLGTLRDMLEKAKPSFASVLPKHLTPDRMTKIALMAASKNPTLLQCTPRSILQSVMQACELGLEPGSMLGGVHLVPFRNKKSGEYECQPVPDYRGLLRLARQSGEIQFVRVEIVYEKDSWTRKNHLDVPFEHEPTDDEEPGVIRGAYCWVKLKDGGSQFAYMPKWEIDRVRRSSRAADGPAWTDWYDEMAKKTVLKRALKYCPMSSQLQRAMEIDTAVESGLPTADIIDVSESVADEAPAPVTKGDALKAKLKGKLEMPPAVVTSLEQSSAEPTPEPPEA